MDKGWVDYRQILQKSLNSQKDSFQLPFLDCILTAASGYTKKMLFHCSPIDNDGSQGRL
jgi:hypothetical protein